VFIPMARCSALGGLKLGGAGRHYRPSGSQPILALASEFPRPELVCSLQADRRNRVFSILSDPLHQSDTAAGGPDHRYGLRSGLS
jgi:hypothetical protein